MASAADRADEGVAVAVAVAVSGGTGAEPLGWPGVDVNVDAAGWGAALMLIASLRWYASSPDRLALVGAAAGGGGGGGPGGGPGGSHGGSPSGGGGATAAGGG